MAPPPTAKTVSLYEQDYALWLQSAIAQLQAGRLSEVDQNHLIEELEDMGRRQKNALKSNLRVVLLHLLKYQHQPSNCSNSWKATLREHRLRIDDELADSPSLKRYLVDIFETCYQQARNLAADETGLDLETFSPSSPFTVENVVDIEYLPD
jgi:hypothetical protein